MIRIFGRSDRDDENLAAEQLRASFLSWRPELSTNDDDVLILVSIQAPGHRGQQDIDLAVITRFRHPIEVKYRRHNNAPEEKIAVWSFCATFEVKGHNLRAVDGRPLVRFQDNKVDVWYDHWHPASLQAAGQGKAFKKRLQRETGVDLWVVSFVWLLRISDAQMHGRLNEPNAVLPASFTPERLAQRVVSLDPPLPGKTSYSVWVKDLDFRTVGEHLSAEAAISPLNRSMVERIVKQRVDFKQFEHLGDEQQVITGRAGAGKTVILLRLARDFYETGKRVAILTYNRALVADVNRLLTHMGVKGPSYEPNVNIITLHAYFISVLRVLFGDIGKIDEEWLRTEYRARLSEAVKYIREGAISQPEIVDGLIAKDFSVFDIACVDEGQDWSDEERDLLHLAIGSKKCVVASGFDQLVRRDTLCDWSAGGKVPTGITRLRRSLRMKSALAAFANAVAEEMGLTGWEVEPDPEMSGGNIVLAVGEYAALDGLHQSVVKSNGDHGNANIDILFCVDRKNVVHSASGVRGSRLAQQLRDLGAVVWDGTIDVNRDDPPRSVKEFRVVQYESCRGLEGWVVVAEHLDQWFDHKRDDFVAKAPRQQLLSDTDSEAKSFASFWAMIPLTRAIDTFVITIQDEDSLLGRVLLRAGRRFPENVVIRS